MKRIFALTLCLLCIVRPLFAEHIKGGEMYYTYDGPGSTANSSVYTVTLKLYIDCHANSPGQLDTQVPFTIIDKATNMPLGASRIAPMTDEKFISFDPATNPCIGFPPDDVCYRIRWFSTKISLTNSPKGYMISYQRCCRINNIVNVASPSNSYGATYLCEIPGTSVLVDAYKNNSPQFVTNDAAAICVNSGFTFSFAAAETDGDSLSYQLCNGFIGGSQAVPNPDVATPPPYISLNYVSPYGGTFPLGTRATINSKTGLITGVAPPVKGQYVITACAYEFRKGVLINVHRKDIHVAVHDCIPLKALLKPDYAYCDDFLVQFRNEQLNPPGSLHIWSYGDGSKSDTSADPVGTVLHQYADTGSYHVKLIVTLAGECIDSTVTLAKVYPGFHPGFTVQGTCVLLPLQFTDTTKARYGAPNKWSWNFGDEASDADTSHLQNPTWKYGASGSKQAILIVQSSKGCIDTVKVPVSVLDRPNVGLAFRDTLICSIDTLQLKASGSGVFSWAPVTNLLSGNTANPLVFPKSTTLYHVTLNENGCINTDSVQVRVVDFVTLNAGPDSTICLTDSVRLHPNSDALYYSWSPAATIVDASAKNAVVFPAQNTMYRVLASIGKCNATDSLNILTVPYPISIAGPDTTVCYDDTAQLNAQLVGSRFNWSPVSSLSSGAVTNPLAFPLHTTSYTLMVFDTLGCPKPGVSHVIVSVREKIIPFAGNDTSIVVDQPLKLRGSGSDLFNWSPPNFLDNPDAQNPVAMLHDNFTYVLRAFTPEGCFALDTINIKVFKTAPDIFVPNAFAPGGHNRLLRPIPVGIATLEYFRVYNRWGQLVYQTSQTGVGWDGTINGKAQESGTYVWTVKGVDFRGKVVIKQGTAVLIR